MRIKAINLKNFRRFSDLTVEGIGESTKLVVLLGPNGSGKSSLFDAFSLAAGVSKHQSYSWNSRYHVKGVVENDDIAMCLRGIEIKFYDSESYPRTNHSPKDFYFRTSYRYEPKAVVERLERMPSILADEKDPHLMMNLDARVSDNYKRMASNSLGELFEPGEANNVSRTELRDKYIVKLRESMKRVFGDLVLEGPGKPLDGGEFLFTKGAVHNFPYTNLSSGEKSAFDLMLDFVIKSEAFDNTVYCLDEPELHMHTALQGKLIEELVSTLPGKSQLWVATHSVGMIRKAREIYERDPCSVVFLDFSGRDFDVPQTIRPTVPSRNVLGEVLKVVIGDVANLIAPTEIIFCEGQKREQGARRNPDFDAKCYNNIFEREFPDTQFVSLGGCNDVNKNSVLFKAVLKECVPGVKVRAVFDGDDRNGEEVAAIGEEGNAVLSRRDLENYLWDDEVLIKLCHQSGHEDMADTLVSAKADLLRAASPSDDVKSIAGALYNKAKELLHLTKCGNSHEAFARDTLSSLITTEMAVYQELRRDIFGGRNQERHVQ